MKRKLNENDVPETVTPAGEKANITFTTLGLDARLLQAVMQQKFAMPTPIQAKAIPLALDAKDVLARAKTGSGKTLAYLLPLLHAILRRKAVDRSTHSTSALVLVPTKELAVQVTETLKTCTSFCAQLVRYENIARNEDGAIIKARLAEAPDVVVATPSRASQWINSQALTLQGLKHLVVDEADLVLSYGYQEDLESIASVLPTGVQKLLMSATLRTEVDTLAQLLFKDTSTPTILDFSAEEAVEQPTLAQYVLKTAEQDKFLLIYTIFKLQLITGKVILFVASIDRCYRVKLFLEQFGIRSCILNSELPVNSRLHVVEEFNKGAYDIIIAADENEIVGNEGGKRKRRKVVKEEGHADEQMEADATAIVAAPAVDEGDADGDAAKTAPLKKQQNGRHNRTDREYGVSRGIDFRNVACVLNFDLPATSNSYTHRIGRTARAGQSGMALSFYVPSELYRKHKPTSIEQCKHDGEVVDQIRREQTKRGAKVEEWAFDMQKLEGFRYRLGDALRAVTRIAIREARTKELRHELIQSEKLKRHFEENPEDLRHLRHDTDTHAVRSQPHLKHVPSYLLPAGGKAAVTKDVGFVSIRKDKENRLRKARAFNKSRGKGRIARTKGLDPLKSLNARGRGKK